MIKVIISGYEFIYKGNISIRMDDVFVHISANGYTDDVEPKYSWDYNIQDTFLTKDVESIESIK